MHFFLINYAKTKNMGLGFDYVNSPDRQKLFSNKTEHHRMIISAISQDAQGDLPWSQQQEGQARS